MENFKITLLLILLRLVDYLPWVLIGLMILVIFFLLKWEGKPKEGKPKK